MNKLIFSKVLITFNSGESVVDWVHSLNTAPTLSYTELTDAQRTWLRDYLNPKQHWFIKFMGWGVREIVGHPVHVRSLESIETIEVLKTVEVPIVDASS